MFAWTDQNHCIIKTHPEGDAKVSVGTIYNADTGATEAFTVCFSQCGSRASNQLLSLRKEIDVRDESSGLQLSVMSLNVLSE